MDKPKVNSSTHDQAQSKWMTFEKKSKNTSDHDDSITDQSNGTGTSATVKAGKDEDQGTSSDHNNSSSIGQAPTSSSKKILTGASIAERTAEWGIAVRSDVGERSFKAIATRSEQEEDGGNRSKKKLIYGGVDEDIRGKRSRRNHSEGIPGAEECSGNIAANVCGL